MKRIETYKAYRTPYGEKVVAAPSEEGGIFLYTLAAWKYEEAPNWELVGETFYPINQQEGTPFKIEDLQNVRRIICGPKV